MNLLRNKLLWSLSLGHFAIDVYTNLTPLMYPLIIVAFDLDYTRVGLIATMFAITSSLAQPLFGYLADRFGGRLMAPLGIVWISVLIGSIGFAPNYYSLLGIMFLAGLGSAAFHPQGAMNASMIGGERRGSAVSVFMLGGNIGFSFGPAIGGALLLTYGLKGTTLLIIPGLILAASVYWTMGAVEKHRKRITSARPISKSPSRIAIVGVASLVLIIMLRSWTMSGINHFLALLYRDLDYPVEAAAQVLFIILMGVATGSLLGGFISDRVGRRKVIFLSLLFLSPATYLFLQTPPPLAFAVAVPMGLLIGASFSITIVMSQELLPQNMGMASGLTLGLAFVTSGIGVAFIGNAADNIGLANALNVLIVLPVVAALLCWSLKPAPARAETVEPSKT